MQISIDRLMTVVETYGKHGIDPKGGLTRPSFSQSDLVVRKNFIDDLRTLGLDVQIDPAANIWGTLQGKYSEAPSIIIGSHLDTVPNGGKFDGALGVLIAKEVIHTLVENNIKLNSPLEIVSFTAEEPNDFNVSTLGSRSFAGKLTSEDLTNVKNSKGHLVKDALREAGGDLGEYGNFHKIRRNKKCYLEVHIEQGRRLERENKSVAIVTDIVGIYRDKVVVKGEPNHSGTTFMNDRKDALTAASELILAAEKVVKENYPDMVGTIGKMDVFPNATNIVPGSVEFILEVRGSKGKVMDVCIANIYQAWDTILSKRGIQIETNPILRQSEVIMDKGLNQLIQKTAEGLGISYSMLNSMAGHDASHTASVCPSTMIFVKSIEGKSHCPEELSLPMDIKLAGDLLLNAILEIDQNM